MGSQTSVGCDYIRIRDHLSIRILRRASFIQRSRGKNVYHAYNDDGKKRISYNNDDKKRLSCNDDGKKRLSYNNDGKKRFSYMIQQSL